MPTPSKGEKRKDFVSRCIPIVKKEDSDLSNSQAAGKCGGMYDSHSSKKDLTFGEKESLVRGAWQAMYGEDPELMYTWPRYVFEDYLVIQVGGKYVKVPYTWVKDGVKFSDVKKWSVVEHSFKSADAFRVVNRPIRAVEAKDGRYRCYGVLFNDSEHKDYYGTYFDKDTDYHLDWYTTRPWLYHHGQHPMMGVVRVGMWDTDGIDDEGVFLEGELEASFKFKGAIETLLDEGALYPSTGTMAYLLDVEKDGHVAEWPIAEASSTVAPADFHQEPISERAQMAVRALLSDGGVTMSKGRDLLSRVIPGFPPTSKPEPEAGAAEQEQEPKKAVEEEAAPATQPGQEPTPSGVDVDTLAVQVAEKLGMDEIVRAIQAIDSTLKDLSTKTATVEKILAGVAKTEVEKISDAVRGADWVQELYSVTRSADPEPEGTELPPAEIHTTTAEGKTIFEQVAGR